MSLVINTAELDKSLAEQATKTARPPLVDGTYKVKVVEIEHGKGFSDPTKFRLKIKWEIISDLAGDVSQAGGLVNQYFSVQGKTEADQLKTAGPVIKVALNAGISQTKIEFDADDYNDVLVNIASLVNKRLAKDEQVEAVLKLTWDGKDEAKKQFWKNLVF